ncbi:MAG: class I SAM-dependent methyltransferase [Variibacter sp.]|nr:class I SAM-dependent methyltransferase [Variibacter sp.]
MSEVQNWDQRYAREDYIFGTEPNAFLAAQRDRLRPGLKALTLADGEGRNGVWLAEQGLDVLALDFASAALEKARRLASARGVALRLEQADLHAWAWPAAAFDVVAAIFIQFSAPPQRQRIFDGIKQALKPGGLLLMQGYRPEQLGYGTGGPPDAERCYTRALLEQAFGDFTSLEIAEHDSVLAEGCWHVGKSALIDLVGIK